MSKLILSVIGASRGSLVDEGRKVEFAKVFASGAFAPSQPDRDAEFLGSSVEVYKATKEAFDGMRGAKLPADFLCEIEMSTSATKGMSIKIISAKPLVAPVKVS